MIFQRIRNNGRVAHLNFFWNFLKWQIWTEVKSPTFFLALDVEGLGRSTAFQDVEGQAHLMGFVRQKEWEGAAFARIHCRPKPG